MQKNTEFDNLPQWDDSQSPFRVPDGYFDELTARVMQRIPVTTSSEPKASRVSFRPYFRWAAVSLATIGVGVGVYWAAMKGGVETPLGKTASQAAAAQMPAGDNLEQMADYMMLDQEDLYAYLSAE